MLNVSLYSASLVSEFEHLLRSLNFKSPSSIIEVHVDLKFITCKDVHVLYLYFMSQARVDYVSLLVSDPDVSITTSPDYSYYHYGENVTLSCIVSYPTNIQNYIDVPTQAKIQWIKDGNVIDNDVDPNDGIYTSILSQSNINTSNRGMYRCTVVIGSNGEYIVNSSEVNVAENITVISG